MIVKKTACNITSKFNVPTLLYQYLLAGRLHHDMERYSVGINNARRQQAHHQGRQTPIKYNKLFQKNT